MCAPVSPSSITPATKAARSTFAVTGGRVDAKTLAGNIRHSGGLLLAQREDLGRESLSLAKLTINVTGNPNLTAVVNGERRLNIADLDLTDAKIRKNVGVTLNPTAMGAINGTFGVALPDTVKLGTANVLVRVTH